MERPVNKVRFVSLWELRGDAINNDTMVRIKVFDNYMTIKTFLSNYSFLFSNYMKRSEMIKKTNSLNILFLECITKLIPMHRDTYGRYWYYCCIQNYTNWALVTELLSADSSFISPHSYTQKVLYTLQIFHCTKRVLYHL